MKEKITIALAGNPNSGKTTLFNALTGSNQFVGNWPGVTVEKKEGKLKKKESVTITDLPGIYSLSPYTLEEVVARNYLVNERPDVILNIVDGTNLERNLYLTTQLTELGIPVVVAVNMMDVVKKNGDEIHTDELARQLGVKVVEISALKGTGITEAANVAIAAAEGEVTIPLHTFSGAVEHAIAHIEEAALHSLPQERQRWYAIKIFERDAKVLESLDLTEYTLSHIEEDIAAAEKELDDDAESIITNERYIYISSIIQSCQKKKQTGGASSSDRIDLIVTNRILGLPIFALVMFLVYWISMGPFGSMMTDWANDGVFGDGWHFFGVGTDAYEEASENYGDTDQILDAFISEYGTEEMAERIDTESDAYEEASAQNALQDLLAATPDDAMITYEVEDEETLEITEYPDTDKATLESAVGAYLSTEDKEAYGAPDPSTYGIWVPGIPVLVGSALESAGVAEWLSGLINDGIIAGVGAVLGFVPQMLILFFLLAFLESCGYMARIAFVLDRVFRKFGLSGKSFIPMLIGTGCGVPGVMASRTIENESDRRMTIMTTTFIPCGAKVPFIAMIAGAIGRDAQRAALKLDCAAIPTFFGGSAWVSTSAYFIGMAAIIMSGIMLKKTKRFAGEPAPFVMELPAYHMPTFVSLLRSMWERGWSFIKKAGTIILLSTIVVWFTTYFGVVDGSFRMLSEDELSLSFLAGIGNAVAWIFAPLGWGTWQATVASVTGLVAKENIVGTMGILYGAEGPAVAVIGQAFTAVTGYSFLVFNLLCAPCFAAIGAIKREMNNAKWTWFAIAWQCGFAYLVALMINQFGGLFTGNVNLIGVLAASVSLCVMLYLIIRPYKETESAKDIIMKKKGLA